MKLLLRGALTNKIYSFSLRTWELDKCTYYNVFDSFLNLIIIEFSRIKITRILPYVNNNLKKNLFFNHNWLPDFLRFSVDSFFENRLLSNFILIFGVPNLLKYKTVFELTNLQFFFYSLSFLNKIFKLLIILFNLFFFKCYLLIKKLKKYISLTVLFNLIFGINFNLEELFNYNLIYLFFGLKNNLNLRNFSKINTHGELKDWLYIFLFNDKLVSIDINFFPYNIILCCNVFSRFLLPVLNNFLRNFSFIKSNSIILLNQISFVNFKSIKLGISFFLLKKFLVFSSFLNLYVNKKKLLILFDFNMLFLFDFIKNIILTNYIVYKIIILFYSLQQLNQVFLNRSLINLARLLPFNLKNTLLIYDFNILNLTKTHYNILGYLNKFEYQFDQILKIKIILSIYLNSHGLFSFKSKFFLYEKLKNFDFFIVTNIFFESVFTSITIEGFLKKKLNSLKILKKNQINFFNLNIFYGFNRKILINNINLYYLIIKKLRFKYINNFVLNLFCRQFKKFIFSNFLLFYPENCILNSSNFLLLNLKNIKLKCSKYYYN